jgi:hypothetical protein
MHTLPVVLAGADVEIIVYPIPDDWYAPETTQRADDFLATVTKSARVQHGLAAVAG